MNLKYQQWKESELMKKKKKKCSFEKEIENIKACVNQTGEKEVSKTIKGNETNFWNVSSASLQERQHQPLKIKVLSRL